MSLIFKIMSRDEWAAFQASGEFAGSAVDLADGYIHFSAADQAQETAAKHFAGRDDLVLLSLDAASLGDRLIWEPSRGGALFPHLYRPLALNEVAASRELTLGVDGVPQLGDLSA
ncbi:DUF952 domain-containing protein [Caulobacter sp. NIBR2454]|uniref:DUF952 domain-containing protein n=1 Tax=Caulobacter sp. NIBR2454 TaxID=3015996 RepID=UPI0022B733F7|nr:DUF952 domain-containing protein [Caulobacter sp. NIBR2454]